MTRFLAAVLLMTCLAGCSSYVNIPPAKGDVARSNPNTSTVRNVQSAALVAVAERVNAPGLAAVQLPAGSTVASYEVVTRPLGEGFIPVSDDRAAEANITYEVRGVRVRTSDAEVDVAATGPTGIAQLYTVQLDYKPISGWDVTRLRQWGTIGDPSAETDKPQPDRARSF